MPSGLFAFATTLLRLNPWRAIMARTFGRGAGISWGITSLILLADMAGLGALAMPAAFARLGGFVPATAAIILLGCIAAYSGSLYARLMSVPLPREKAGGDADMLDEVGEEAMGVVGRALVYVLADLLIILAPVLTFVAAVESFQQILHGVRKTWDVDIDLHRLYCTLIVAAVTLLLLQVRKLRDLGSVSAIGAISILVALVIIIMKLVWLDKHEYEAEPGRQPAWAARVPVLPAAVGVMDVLFGYAGQQAWPRFIVAMRRPRLNFKLATSAVIPTIGAALLAVGAVGYWRLGENFDLSKPVSSVLKPDGWLVAANVGVLIQSVVATVLNLNTWVWNVMAIYIKAVDRRRRGSSYERLRADPEPVAPLPAGIEEGIPAAACPDTESMHTPFMSEDPGTPHAFTGAAGEPSGTEFPSATAEAPAAGAPGGGYAAGAAGAGYAAGAEGGGFTAGAAGRVEPDPVDLSRWLWLVLSVVGLAGAAVAAYFMPFFAEMMALVGSLADTAVMMTLPALFALILLPKHEELPRWEWWLLLAMVVLSVGGAAFGCTASIWQIKRKLRHA